MKNAYNKLTCLFGFHEYSDKLTKDIHGRYIYLCKICKRSGHRQWYSGRETWRDYGKRGNCIHVKCSDGFELWKNHYNRWVETKPKNWERENV